MVNNGGELLGKRYRSNYLTNKGIEELDLTVTTENGEKVPFLQRRSLGKVLASATSAEGINLI